MTAGTVILALVVGGAAVSGVAYLLARLFRLVPWQPLPLPYQEALYFGPVEPARLVDALLTVTRLLSHHVPGWPYSAVARALADVRVFVYPRSTFTGSGGVDVAGEQDGVHLYVGVDLSALCHEAAHRVGEVLDGNAYRTHAGWESNGIGRAISAYHSWLKETPS